MVGFQAPGASAKYRLGNEADTYGEITFGNNFYGEYRSAFKVEDATGEITAAGGPDRPVSDHSCDPHPDPATLISSGSANVSFAEIWGLGGQCCFIAAVAEVLGRQPVLPAARHPSQ